MAERYVPSPDALRFQHAVNTQVYPQGIHIFTRDLTTALAGPEHTGIYGTVIPEKRAMARHRLAQGSHTIAVDLWTYDRTYIGYQLLEQTRKQIHTLARDCHGNPKLGTGDIRENIRHIPMGPEVPLGPIDFKNSTLDGYMEVIFRASQKNLS